MRSLNSQPAGLAREIFVQLSVEQQILIESIASSINSGNAWKYLDVGEFEERVKALEEYLEDDRNERVNSRNQLSWPHPVALPKPEADDDVFVSWVYDEKGHTYIPRKVFYLMSKGAHLRAVDFGLVRLLCLWHSMFRYEIRKRTETVSAESSVLCLQEAWVGLERAGLMNEAIARHGKKIHSELGKLIKRTANRS